MLVAIYRLKSFSTNTLLVCDLFWITWYYLLTWHPPRDTRWKTVLLHKFKTSFESNGQFNFVHLSWLRYLYSWMSTQYTASVKKPCPLIRRAAKCHPLAGWIAGARWVARRRVAVARASLRQRRASDAHTSRRAASTGTHTHLVTSRAYAEFVQRWRPRSKCIQTRRPHVRSRIRMNNLYTYTHASRTRAWCVAPAVSSRRRATCSLHTTLICALSYASTTRTWDRITRSRAVHTTCCTPFTRSRAPTRTRALIHTHTRARASPHQQPNHSYYSWRLYR